MTANFAFASDNDLKLVTGMKMGTGIRRPSRIEMIETGVGCFGRFTGTKERGFYVCLAPSGILTLYLIFFASSYAITNAMEFSLWIVDKACGATSCGAPSSERRCQAAHIFEVRYIAGIASGRK